MAGFTRPHPTVLFLSCGCPQDQGCECKFYPGGCGACSGCLMPPEIMAQLLLETPKCKFSTGYNRLKIDDFVFAYDRNATCGKNVSRVLAGRVWYREMSWMFRSLAGVDRLLRIEYAAHEKQLQNVNNASMRCEDERNIIIIKPTGKTGEHAYGMFVDVDIVHDNALQQQRARLDIVLPVLQEKLKQCQEMLAKYTQAQVLVAKRRRELCGFHIVRLVRGFLGRVHFRQEAQRQTENFAATMIQSCFRRYYAYRYTYLPKWHAFRYKMATILQSAWRTFRLRVPYLQRVYARRLYLRICAATKMQSLFRGHKGRLSLKGRHPTAHKRKVGTQTLATPTAVLAAFAAYEATARRWKGDDKITPIRDSTVDIFQRITYDAVAARARKDFDKLMPIVARQTTGATLARATRMGYGKWSSSRAIGTANFLRRFATRPQQLLYYYDVWHSPPVSRASTAVTSTRPPTTARTPAQSMFSEERKKADEEHFEAVLRAALMDSEAARDTNMGVVDRVIPPRAGTPTGPYKMIHENPKNARKLAAFALTSLGMSVEVAKAMVKPPIAARGTVIDVMEQQKQRLRERAQARKAHHRPGSSDASRASSRPSTTTTVTTVSKPGAEVIPYPSSRERTTRLNVGYIVELPMSMSRINTPAAASVNRSVASAASSVGRSAWAEALDPTPKTAVEEAMDEVDRLAELNLAPHFFPVSEDIDFDALSEHLPIPHIYLPSFDDYMKFVMLATGVPSEDFLTVQEYAKLRRRKAVFLSMTEPLEEAAALVGAAGVVDSVIDAVASYLQHLAICNRGMQEDLEKLEKASASRPGTRAAP